MKTPALPSPTSLPWQTRKTTHSVPLVVPALTAAATALSPRPVGRPAKGSSIRQTTEIVSRSRDLAWQTEAIAAYGQIPELHYVMNSNARAASQALIVPDTSDTSDGPESATTSATNPSRPANAVPVGTSFRMALLLSLVGECYLVSRRDDVTLTGIDVLSPLEVVWDYSTGIARLPAQWGFYNSNNIAGNKIRLTRVHQPDAALWMRADSSVRAALPVLRELIGHTMATSACIDSRIVNAGVFHYPASAAAATPPDGSGQAHDADMPLGDALLEAFSTAIANQGSAEARVPVMVELPDEIDKDSLGFIDFATKMDAQTKELTDLAIRRLAIGLDAPAEVLLGLQNTTSHFATWAVQDDYVRMHIAPLLELMVDGIDVHTLTKHTFDLSPLQRRPNLGVEAIQLFDRDLLSARSTRLANSFTDEDAPADKSDDINQAAWERLESLLHKSPSLAQTPGIPAVLDQIKAAMRGETPENAIYPSQPVVVSESEVPRGPGAPVPDRDDPRAAPPAAKPRTAEPRSDGSPNGGSKGRPAPLPSTNT